MNRSLTRVKYNVSYIFTKNSDKEVLTDSSCDKIAAAIRIW